MAICRFFCNQMYTCFMSLVDLFTLCIANHAPPYRQVINHMAVYLSIVYTFLAVGVEEVFCPS